MSCTASSTNPAVPLHFATVADLTTGSTFMAGPKPPCNKGGIAEPQTLTFAATPGHKYRVTVMNCTGNRTIYQVADNGTVTVIKAT